MNSHSDIIVTEEMEISANLRSLIVDSKLDILSLLLREKSLCVCRIAELAGMSNSLTSHHLGDLKGMKLVKSSSQSRFVIYSLTGKGKKVITLINKLQKEIIK